MSSMSRIFVTAALLAATLACSGGATEAPKKVENVKPKPAPPPAEFVGTKLASVDGMPVGSRSFEILATRKTPADGKAFTLDEKKDVLGEAITDEVLFQAAFDRALYQDPKVRKIMVNLLLREEVYGTVTNDDFTEEEQRTFFEEHKEEFVVPEKIQVKRVFVAETEGRDSKARADEARTKIMADPEAFRDVAAEYSDGPFKRRGGDLGYVSRDGKPGLPPEVLGKAFELEVGVVSEPFMAGGGWNVLLVPNKRERLERTFEQMRGSVLRRLKNDRYDSLADDFIGKLKAERKVEIDESALGAYAPPSPGSRPGFPMDKPQGLEALAQPKSPDELDPDDDEDAFKKALMNQDENE
jgi:hypothetical protein